MRDRDASIVLVALLLLSTFTYIVIFVPENVRARVLYVGGVGAGNYTTIQSAVDASIPGDTIYVYSGIYHENVIVDRPLTLVGEDMESSIVDADGLGDPVKVTSDWVNVSRFTFTDSRLAIPFVVYAGLRLLYVQNCTIVNLNASANGGHGIYLDHSHNNTIANNRLTSNKWTGISLEYSTHNIIENNTAIDNFEGIEVDYSAYSKIVNNTASYNRNGGIFFDHSSDYLEVRYNRASFNENFGIHGGWIDNSTIAGNIASYNKCGLGIGHSDNITIRDNIFSGNDWDGILFERMRFSTFRNNTIALNGMYGGIRPQYTYEYNLITQNNIVGNSEGIYFYYAHNISVVNNYISQNPYGIYAFESDDNIMVNNTIHQNSKYGLYFTSLTFRNKVYHNRIIDNAVQAFDVGNGATNEWDDGYPSGGNYWSDYYGTDFHNGPNQDLFGNDGIGDTHYEIDWDSWDRYPLVDFNVPPPPENLISETASMTNIRLTWKAPDSPDVHHYLIYRSADQRNFDFSKSLYNTTDSLNPLSRSWVDVGAANTTSPREYYYVVRAVSRTGGVSFNSNTAGKWTRDFSEGRDAFSLPLEPFADKNISWYSENIPGTESIRWMNEAGHWVTHYASMGEGLNDAPATMGDSYEISLSSPVNFTFCGYPASIIRFHEGFGDSITFRKSLSAEADGTNVNLSWEAVSGASQYSVFRSEQRNGLHNLSLSPMANVTSTDWKDIGAIGNNDSEFYYMVIPVGPLGELGSSTYSVGVISVEYESGSDTFALPVKPVETHMLDWFCDYVPNVVGTAYLISEMWKFHAKEMPEGVYDVEVLQGEGFQISFIGPATRFTFVGY